MQTALTVRIIDCQPPSFEQALPACDRDLWYWLTGLMLSSMTDIHRNEQARILAAVSRAQTEAVAACITSRSAPPSPAPQGVSVSIHASLNGQSAGLPAPSGIRSIVRIAVAPQTPALSTCQPLSFLLFHNITGITLSTPYTDAVMEFLTGDVPGFPPENDGIGPWSGGKVYFNETPPANQGWPASARLRIARVFEHSLGSELASQWPVPSALLSRAQPFDGAQATFVTSVSPGTDRLRIIVQFDNLDDGRRFVQDFLTPATGLVADGPGYRLDMTVSWTVPVDTLAAGSRWLQRAYAVEYQRDPTEVRASYAGNEVAVAETEVTPLHAQAFDPASWNTLAHCETEGVPVYTLGRAKASFRIVGYETVVGMGVVVVFRLINELHFPACIVSSCVQFTEEWHVVTSHWLGSGSYYEFDMTNRTHQLWLVRNLPAHSESADIRILYPARHTYVPPRYSRNWRVQPCIGWALPYGYKPNGLYSSNDRVNGVLSHPIPCRAWTNHELVPPPDAALVACHAPACSAELWSYFDRAGSRQLGVEQWNPTQHWAGGSGGNWVDGPGPVHWGPWGIRHESLPSLTPLDRIITNREGRPPYPGDGKAWGIPKTLTAQLWTLTNGQANYDGISYVGLTELIHLLGPGNVPVMGNLSVNPADARRYRHFEYVTNGSETFSQTDLLVFDRWVSDNPDAPTTSEEMTALLMPVIRTVSGSYALWPARLVIYPLMTHTNNDTTGDGYATLGEQSLNGFGIQELTRSDRISVRWT